MKVTEYSHIINKYEKLPESNQQPSTSRLSHLTLVTNCPTASLSPKQQQACQTAKVKEQSNFGAGIDILTHTYRTQRLSPEDIKNLLLTSKDINNYIHNSECTRLDKGREGINSFAAAQVNKTIKEKYFKCLINDSDARQAVRNLDDKQKIAFLKLISTDEKYRTTSMLADAGILKERLIVRHYNVFDELISEGIDLEHMEEAEVKEWMDLTRVNSGIFINCPEQRKEMRESTERAITTLKSDSFIRAWLKQGFSTAAEHKECMGLAKSLINCQYSNLSNMTLAHINFDNADLTGSNFDNSKLFRCSIDIENIENVSINKTVFEECGWGCDSDSDSDYDYDSNYDSDYDL
ncbi:pentapeptide repeat-containing protein [Kalamiella sp. sgz302252]|uniref:pentapeptide repeat-containing protein n=1 Tax=Pantoea sp. sgz302252 TaxID=3341827 RepID=UPI0036D26223